MGPMARVGVANEGVADSPAIQVGTSSMGSCQDRNASDLRWPGNRRWYMHHTYFVGCFHICHHLFVCHICTLCDFDYDTMASPYTSELFHCVVDFVTVGTLNICQKPHNGLELLRWLRGNFFCKPYSIECIVHVRTRLPQKVQYVSGELWIYVFYFNFKKCKTYVAHHTSKLITCCIHTVVLPYTIIFW